MGIRQRIWASPAAYLAAERPEEPALLLAPSVIQASARRFLDGFRGLVTYAVKANPDQAVLGNLAAAGVAGFDVASPHEMVAVRAAVPGATLHYNNPVRSSAEIAAAVAMKCASYAVDSQSELEKLAAQLPPRTEIAVRFRLPIEGGAYDFGTKFGATPEEAAQLLRQVVDLGFRPAMTFHPGTQCRAPQAWAAYVGAAAEISRAAGVPLGRLNVGGGFPARRDAADDLPLEKIFEAIHRTAEKVFGARPPGLVCEPGRAMVAEGVTLATRVKAMRNGVQVFLNDGTYGALAELPLMGVPDRLTVLSPDGLRRRGAPVLRHIFGPTCDSIDRLPGEVALPSDLAEGDYLLFHGFGAYSAATTTRFNGYGTLRHALVLTPC